MTDFSIEALHGLVDTHVCQVPSEREGVKLTARTGEAFVRMRAKAMEDGLELHVASGFRDFSRQNLIYSGKFNGTRTVLDRFENPIDVSTMSDDEKVRTILYFSAVPGLSRHHWGTDLDVYAANLLAPGEELDLTNRLYGEGAQRPLSLWLDAHMSEFGFFRPYVHDGLTAGELWHISFAPEADRFTALLDENEALDFCAKEKLSGTQCLENIIKNEFEARFLIEGKVGKHFQVKNS